MNPALRSLSHSLIRQLNDRKRPDAIDLGLGQPRLLPAMAPLMRALAWVEANGCPYSPNLGFRELREAIARYHRLPGLDDAAAVCVTIGSQQALHVALKGLLAPGEDEVLIVEPAFPAYRKMCLLEGVTARSVGLDPATGFAADAEAVLAALTPRTRLVMLSSPSNPTGRVWPEAALQRLSAGLLEASAQRSEPIYILSDEVYRELYFTETPPPSPAQFYPHTLVAGSLSKSCALTGLRLGWLLATPPLLGELLKVHQLTVSCADTVAQRAAIELFQAGDGQGSLLTAHLAHYRSQHAALLAALAEAGLDYVPPDGTFYCLIRLPGRWARDSLGAAQSLMDAYNVVAIPGGAFAAEGFLRVSFVAPAEVLREGLLRIAAFLGATAYDEPA